MGVITIRQSTAQLGNLGATPVRQVHTPNYHLNRRTGEADAIASQQRIARGMQNFGKAVLDVAMALKRDQTNIALNEAEAEYEKAVRDRMMDPKSGFLAMNLDNSGAIESFAKDSSKMLNDMRDEIAKKHELSGGTREAFNNRTQGVYSGWSRQIAGRTLKAHDVLKRNAAANLTEQKYQDWLLNPVDIDSTKELVDSFRAQCYTNGYDDQAAAMNVDKYCRGLAFDYATHTFKSIQDEKGVEAAIEQLEKNPNGILATNAALAEHFGKRIPFDKKGLRALRGSLETRRREIHARDERRVDEAANVGIIAVAAIRDKDGNYPKDRLPTIEHAITHLQDLTVALPKGSRAAALAATQASDLNAKADMIAQQEMIDEYLNELKTNPKAKIYAPEAKNEKGEVSPARNAYIGSGRKERLAPMVQQHFDVQRMKERHPQEVAALRSQMLAATASPGSFVGKCDQSLMDGRISLLERNELVEDFMKDWTTNGKPQLARDILFSIQTAFPDAPISASFEWSAKESAMVPVKKPELEKLTYKRKKQGDELSSSFKRFFNPYGAWGYDLLPEKDSLSIEQLADLIRVAGNLGAYDGKVIDYDPILGGSKDGKDFFGDEIKKDQPFSARAYFNKYLSRLKDVKKAEKAGDFIERWINAEANMREIELQRQEKAGIR